LLTESLSPDISRYSKNSEPTKERTPDYAGQKTLFSLPLGKGEREEGDKAHKIGGFYINSRSLCG